MDIHFSDVLLPDILYNDDSFKISRPGPTQKLSESVKKLGVLEPPFLLHTGSGFIPVTGHNRLAAARNAAYTSVQCGIVTQPENSWFLSHAVLKNFRGELGPVGRLKTAALISSGKLSCDHVDAKKTYAALDIPAEIFGRYAEAILSLDAAIQNYGDEKNLPYKILIQITMLPLEARMFLLSWISLRQVKMNYFRSAVEYLSELQRGGLISDAVDAAEGIVAESSDEGIVEMLYMRLFPVYSTMKEKSLLLADEFRKGGIDLKYPPFFEGDFAECCIRIRRKDGGASCKKAAAFLLDADYEKVNSLL